MYTANVMFTSVPENIGQDCRYMKCIGFGGTNILGKTNNYLASALSLEVMKHYRKRSVIRNSRAM